MKNYIDMKNIILYTLLILPLFSFGQNIKIEIDTNSILIGEQTKMRIGITYRVDTGNEIEMQFPIIGDTLLKQIEVTNKEKVDTSIVDKENPYVFQQTQELTITSFDVGKYTLPPFIFILNNDTIYSPLIPFEVRDVLVEENSELKKIKDPLKDPFTIWDWFYKNWIIISTILGAVLAVILLIYFLTKIKSKEKKVKPIVVIPAHITALKKLEKIQLANLWQDGKFKKYHSEISEVIREYLENRYDIHALEQTSDEIISALRLKTMSQLNKENLQQLLVLADLVKFAKEIPIGSENEESMKNAIAFVEETKIIDTPIEQKEQQV